MAAPQWHFEDFRLDPVNARLWRGAEPLALPPKVFDVLYYLVTHPDRLVTKAELLDTIWPNTAVTDLWCAWPLAPCVRHWAIYGIPFTSLRRCRGAAIAS